MPSVTTPKGSGSAERLVMSTSTSPPASAVESQVKLKPGDQNMQLIKTLMTDCINQYNNLLPQLDMLAVHHGLPLFDEGGEVDDTTSLRSEAAQSRRRQELDVNLTEQLKDVHTYIANQTQAQNTGLQRRYKYQE
jgi:hypothetical protein